VQNTKNPGASKAPADERKRCMHAGVASSRLFEKLKMHPSHAERQTNGGARRRLKGSAETNKSWYTKKVAESGAKWKKMSLLALLLP